MSRTLDPVVPAALAARLAPGAPLPEGFTLLLLSIRDDGWPHQAMLSAGEVVALDERRLALALWPRSTAAANLAQRPRATLAAVADGVGWALRLAVLERDPLETTLGGTLRHFSAEVVAATADEAPYAELTSGVVFRLKEPASVLPRWEQVRSALALAGAEDAR